MTLRLILCAAVMAAMLSPQVIFLKKKVAGATYLVNEDCEGTGTPGGWTNVNTVDWDEGTVVLDGTQSLEILGSATPNQTYHTFAAQPELWIRFKWRASSVSFTRSFLYLNSDGSTSKANVVNASTGMRIYQGSVLATTVALPAANTTYNVWIHYRASTGVNDGFASISFSTSDTEPTSGDNYAEVTTGTSTATVSEIRPLVSAASMNVFFDRITVDDVAIGNF
jgi:hypothetical protein